MRAHVSRILVCSAWLALALMWGVEVSGKAVVVSADMADELIGSPVFASDGPEVGTVVDVAFDDHDQPDRLRMTTDAKLGLGARTLEIPQGAFMVLRGAVVLDLPAVAVQSLPEMEEDRRDD